MIWSVSTLLRRSGRTVPVCWVKASMSCPPRGRRSADRGQVGGAGEVTGHRGRGGDRDRDEVRAAALALPSLEVPVGCGGAALTGRELVGVHAQAHRAPGTAPLGAGLDEHLVQ